ncbi:MAG: MATE family efflux transporter [Peptostreptococcaceae bacterium]
MQNSISKSFSFSSLIKFTMPSIVMLVFMSLYTIVDGIFVSRFVNTDALSAVNIMYPFINVVIAVGVMLASGSSAVIAKKLGEGKEEEAKENFTLIIIVGLLIGIVISILGFIFSEELIYTLGSTKELYEYCKDYHLASLIFIPAFIINLLYQLLTITAGKPNIGLMLTLIGGISNMVLDYVFIVPMNMGIAGAAYATGMGNLIPAILGTIYFFMKKSSLYFVKPKIDFKVILQTCYNGSSEMVTNLSSGITTMLYNIVMLNLLGSDGVAAITIVLYGQFLITSAFIGFSSGVAPIISYNYGDKNEKELKKVIRYSFIFIAISSVVLFIIAKLSSGVIVGMFAPKDSNVFEIGYNGFNIFALSFLVVGFNIFTSSMFTAFSNGKISATVSFLRSFLFISSGIIMLPKILGTDGVWLAMPIAEILALSVSIIFINKYKNVYGYSRIKKSQKEDYLEEVNNLKL